MSTLGPWHPLFLLALLCSLCTTDKERAQRSHLRKFFMLGDVCVQLVFLGKRAVISNSGSRCNTQLYLREAWQWQWKPLLTSCFQGGSWHQSEEFIQEGDMKFYQTRANLRKFSQVINHWKTSNPRYFFCSISCLWWWPVCWGKAAEKGKYVVLLLGIHPSLAQNVEVRKWSWCILDFWKATVCALWAHLSPHKDHLNEKFEERNTFSFFTKLEGLKGAQVQS